jgi:hypothetical protein
MKRISRFALLGAGLLLCTLGFAHAAGTATSVAGLYYTGVNDTGGLLASGTDSHWTVTSAVLNGNTNTAYQGAAYVVNPIDSGWVDNTASAQWITAPGALNSSGTANAGGDRLPGSGTGTGNGYNSASYTYTLTFYINGSDPVGTTVSNKVSITLTLAADDQAQIYINGAAAGPLQTSAWTSTNQVTLHNYNDGSAANANFKIGANTLAIKVDNTDSKTGKQSANLNASGLLVYQTGTAILIDGKPNPVPEVGVWLPVVGALGLFFWQRRRQSAKSDSVA